MLSRVIIVSIVGVLFASYLQGEERVDYFKQFGKNPVRVRIVTGIPRDVELLGIAEKELELKPLDSTEARITIPLDHIDEFQLRYLYPPDFDKAKELVEKGKFDEAVTLLRPLVYPLVPYMPLPNENLNIHGLVKMFLQTLIFADELIEASGIVLKLPLEKLDEDFFSSAFILAEKLIERENSMEALRLLGRVPFSEDHTEIFPQIMAFADKLRTKEQYEEALFLYKRVQNVPDNPLKNIAGLWTAYCNVRLERIETARLFLDLIPDIERDVAEFSLYQLILARINLMNDSYADALEAVSQGLVYSRISYSWAPEMLYVNAQCNEALERYAVARSIYNEIKLFFPDNYWSERSDQQLEVLPREKEEDKGTEEVEDETSKGEHSESDSQVDRLMAE